MRPCAPWPPGAGARSRKRRRAWGRGRIRRGAAGVRRSLAGDEGDAPPETRLRVASERDRPCAAELDGWE